MLEVFLDILVDSLKILPILYVAYLLVELIERKADLTKLVARGKYGSIPGAFLGVIPQCGFTPAASKLYASGLISMGTLLAVFISTSDEALVILIGGGSGFSDGLYLVLGKVIIAVAVGLTMDIFAKKVTKNDGKTVEYADIFVKKIVKNDGKTAKKHVETGCKCRNENIFFASLKHTALIFAYIFAFFLVFEYAIFFIGEENVAKILLKGNFFQPFITALFGFIPSCASSVLLTNLYVDGTLSFASALAGLITNSGMGLLVLFKVNKNKVQNLKIMGILYFTAIISGIIVGLF